MDKINFDNNLYSTETFAKFAPGRFANNFVNLSAQKPDKFEKKGEDPSLSDVKDLKDAKKYVKAKMYAATGGGVLLIGLGIIAFRPDNLKKLSKWLNKQSGRLKLKSESKNQQKSINKIGSKIYSGLSDGLQMIINFGSNLSIVKDVTTIEVVEKIPVFNKVFNQCTKWFSDIADNRIKSRYKGSDRMINEYKACLEDLVGELKAGKSYKVSMHDYGDIEETVKNTIKESEIIDVLGSKFIKDAKTGKVKAGKKLSAFLKNVDLKGNKVKINSSVKRSDVLEVVIEQIDHSQQNLVGGLDARKINLEAKVDKVRDKLIEEHKKQVAKVRGYKSGTNNLLVDNTKDIKAQTITKKEKDELKKVVFTSKEKLSRTLNDNSSRATELLEHVMDDLNTVKDVDSDKLRKIRKTITKLEKETLYGYKHQLKSDDLTISASKNMHQKDFIDTVDKLKEEIINTLKGTKNSKEVQERVLDRLERSQEVLSSDEMGWMQKARKVLKVSLEGINSSSIEKDSLNFLKAVSPEKFEKIRSLEASVSDNLTKTAKFEADNYFERKRDLKLGAATSEVIGTAIPLAYVPVSVMNAKTDEDKNRIATKQGLPILGGIAGWLYTGLYQLYNAPKAMMFSLASGVLFSKAGNVMHKNYIKNHPAKDKVAENPTLKTGA